MTVPVNLLIPGSRQQPHFDIGGFSGEPNLVTVTEPGAHGVFRSATRTEAGTTAVVTPKSEEALILTDLIVASQKFSSGTLEVLFTDDTKSVSIFKIDVTDTPIFLAIPFAGLWQGWQAARIDMVTVNDGDATVSCGYMKIKPGLPFANWDALR